MFDLSTSTTALRTPFSSPAVVSADNILIADDILSPSLQPPITKHQSLPRPTFTIYSEETIPPYKTPRAQAFLRESLPYLLGSGGTLCFDVVIVTQGIIYGRREQLEDEEDDDDDDEEDEDEGDEGEGEEDEDDDEAGNRDAPERSPSRNRSSSVADSIVSRRAS